MRVGFNAVCKAAVAMLVVAPILILAAISSASAGRWINGGTYDEQRGVGVNFLRFLAGEGEGQMTVRCDNADGVWIDAGVDGDGRLPEGITMGDELAAIFTFVSGQAEEFIFAAGPVLVRGDGAVLVSITGEDALPLGRRLVLPAERVDVSIAGTTRPVPLGDVLERLQNLAARCEAWPQ